MAARSLGPADRGVQGVHQLAGPAAGPQCRERPEPVKPPLKHSLRPRLTAIAPSLADVVRSAGGWLFDQAMAGWDVTVITADHADPRPATILGARARDLDTVLTSAVWGPCLQAVAVQADLYDDDPRVRRLVLGTLDGLPGEVRLWGEGWPSDLDAAGPVGHELSVAARAFKAQALAALPALPPPAAASAPDPGEPTEVFRRAKLRRPSLVPAG